MAMKMLNNPESPGPKTDKESTIVNDQWNRYVRARDNGHVEYLASAKKCQDFYEGDQWEPQDRAKLEDEGRPALTINLILATVNAVLGEQAANSVEFRYTPKMEGGEDVPSLMNKVASAIQDANNYDWVESEVFSDGVIIDRGFFDVRIQFDDNLQGEIKITADDPMTILLDPDASQYEPENWGEVWQTKWMSLDKVEETYGKKKRQEVENIAGSINSTFGQDSVLWEEAANTFGEKDETALTMNLGAMSDDETKTIRLIRVIERQHKRMEPTWEFVDMQTGDTKVVPPTWDDQRREQFAMTHGLGMIKRAKERIRWTVTADRVLLHDDWSPYSTFTKIPFFCYFRRGRPFGLVKNLLSPQEQLNKLASQELAIVNTTANSGWIMERNSLAGMTADDLRNQGAESGLVLEINPGKMPPEKIKPNPVPAGIERAAIKSAEFIRTISGVNNAQLGIDNPEVSGVALKQKEMRGQVQLQVPLENLQRTRAIMAAKILELVQQFYTERRVFNISTAGMGQSNLQDPKNERLIVNQQLASGEVINDITLGKYDISMNVIPSRDSWEDQQFAEALNLRNVGVLIPDDRVVEYSHLAHKEELAEEIRKMQGRGELTPQEQQMAAEQQAAQRALMQLEVQKLAMEVRKLEAEAHAKMAELDPNSPEYEMEREELDVKVQLAREELQLRRDLAGLSSNTQLRSDAMKLKTDIGKTTQQSRLSLTQSREKNLADIEREQMKLRSQSKGIDRTIRKD